MFDVVGRGFVVAAAGYCVLSQSVVVLNCSLLLLAVKSVCLPCWAVGEPVPSKWVMKMRKLSEFRSCVNREVGLLSHALSHSPLPSPVSRMVSVDVKYHERKRES